MRLIKFLENSFIFKGKYKRFYIEILAVLILIVYFILWHYETKIIAYPFQGISGILFFIVYFIGFKLVEILTQKFPTNRIIKSKIFNILSTIYAIPLIILFLLYRIFIPVISIFAYAFTFALIIFSLPLTFIAINDYFGLVKLSDENCIFITLTFSSIVSIIFFRYINICSNKVNSLILFLYGFRKAEKLNLKEMIEYIMTPNNLRFAIYSIYFIYLCIFSFNYLEGSSAYVPKSTNSAVMQSFLTFVAFDSLINNSKDFRLLPSKLLSKILRILTDILLHIADDDEEEEKKEN